jgi:signal transduction histidine kinase
MVKTVKRLESLVAAAAAMLYKRKLFIELAKSEKKAVLGLLAAGVAHELRTVLNTIRHSTELLPLAKDGVEQKRLLSYIPEEVDRGAEIINQLLDVVRSDDAKSKPCHINAILENTVRLVQPQLKLDQISVEMNLKPDLPLVYANEGQLKQVFLNIIVNAHQAMKGTKDGKLTLTTREGLKHVLISFADTGPGITVEDQKQIFDPFFTTKPPGKGIGLGLSLSQSFVETVGGQIRVESQLGQGATAIQQTREAMKLIEAIEEKVEAEVELDNAKAKAEWIETLSLWTGHAVKNRNWVISGRAKLLRESASTDKERNDLDVILRKAYEIDRILEKFRYVSMKSEVAIHPRPTALHHLIASTLEEVKRRSSDWKVTVQKDFDDALGEVQIDPVEMKEVLTNLVTNALRAMPDGGTLTLKTKRDNGWLRISISDTGRGISAENQKHLFKPFFSTTSGGLGLGLWLARQIVENHGGELDLKNRDEEKGAEALIKLPLEGGEPSGEVENSDS